MRTRYVITATLSTVLAAQKPATPPPAATPAAAPSPRARAKELWVRKDAEWGKAFDAAVDWLLRHQDDNGHWDTAGFMKHDPEDKQESGGGSPVVDVGITGLAMLVLTADGSTLAQGRNQDAIARAFDWLAEQQQSDGSLQVANFEGFFYAHCAATWGMAEAMRRVKDDKRMRQLRLAADYVVKFRNPRPNKNSKPGWRYLKAGGDADTSITAWAAHTLLAAREAGVDVPDAPFNDACAWFALATDPETGHLGYNEPGTMSSRRPEFLDAFPGEYTELLTAEALSVRMLLGQDVRKDKVTALGLAKVQALVPVWLPAKGSVDSMYWWYGAEVTSQVGGEAGKAWQKRLKECVVKTQASGKEGPNEGPAAGSWGVDDPWSADGGRIYVTCMMALALASPWRLAK